MRKIYAFVVLIMLLSCSLNAQITDSIPADTLSGEIYPEWQRKQDSIRLRLQFIEDSLKAREKFIRDSIERKRIFDSVTSLRIELNRLLEAYVRSVRDELILKCNGIKITPDTSLGTFDYITLPFGVRDPYSPWKTKIGLTGRTVKLSRDAVGGRLVSIHTPQLKTSFVYPREANMLILKQPVSIQKNWAGNFYKIPIDTVIYDRNGKIAKIKSYVLFYALINNNQQGNLLFANKTFVRQYVYDSNKNISSFQIVRFCERWKAYETNKVCSIITYTISRKGDTYVLNRKNDPANQYSDGTYTFNFDSDENLKGISFSNLANTENWNRTIELNSDGYVSCYIDKSNNIITQSLCMIYHKEAGAPHAVETITTTFEKDGISYLQKNNTTGKMRTRDRMTLEWSPWK